MRYEVGEQSGLLIDLVWDCEEAIPLSCEWVDTDKKQFKLAKHPLPTAAKRMIVASRVVYVNPPFGRPLPDLGEHQPHRHFKSPR
jgi:hypothetical protein